MPNERKEPQTFNAAWDNFVAATGYWRFIFWLLDRMTAGLNWLTRRIGAANVRRIWLAMRVAQWLGVALAFGLLAFGLLAFGLLAFGIVRAIVTGHVGDALLVVAYFGAWLGLFALAFALFRKWWKGRGAGPRMGDSDAMPHMRRHGVWQRRNKR